MKTEGYQPRGARPATPTVGSAVAPAGRHTVADMHILCSAPRCPFSDHCARHKDAGAEAGPGDVWGLWKPDYEAYRQIEDATRPGVIRRRICKGYVPAKASRKAVRHE